MALFTAGDKVEFLADFSKGDVYIPVGYVGVVRKDGPPPPGEGFQFVSVVAKRVIWLCKPSEIRKVGRRI